MTTQTKHNQKCVKRGKVWVNAGDQVVFGFRFASDGLKSGESFLDQSKSEVKQNQGNFRQLLPLNLKLLQDSHDSS